MLNNKFSLIIISSFLFLSLFLNLYFYKNIDLDKETKVENGYYIKNSSLFIDYPEFIKNSDIYTEQILSRYDGFNAEQIFIENINGNDFDFLSNITSKIYFNYYFFDFYKYDDEDNYIFDSINKIRGPKRININFHSKLEGEDTLIKTLTKINSVINEIVSNNYLLDKSKNTIESFSLHGFDSFLDSYLLSKADMEIIYNMKVKSFVHRVNIDKDNFSEDYIIRYLKNTEINNFSSFLNYLKHDGNVYKVTNGEWELINSGK
ncbi:MAG: hypothetical protein PHH06_03850 [Candidatus Gracilibacteria bacterium]|nr:hypothetical protein [Candidatus Gracilibacteria bacterium]